MPGVNSKHLYCPITSDPTSRSNQAVAAAESFCMPSIELTTKEKKILRFLSKSLDRITKENKDLEDFVDTFKNAKNSETRELFRTIAIQIMRSQQKEDTFINAGVFLICSAAFFHNKKTAVCLIKAYHEQLNIDSKNRGEINGNFTACFNWHKSTTGADLTQYFDFLKTDFIELSISKFILPVSGFYKDISPDEAIPFVKYCFDLLISTK